MMSKDSSGSGAPRLSIATAIICITIVGLGLSLSLLLMNFVLEARGASGLTIGLITAMGGLATIAVAPVTPYIVRRFGAKLTLVAAIVLLAASVLPLYWLEPLWLWFVMRFLNGIGLALVLVVSEFWINALVPSGRRGFILGIYAASESLGFAAGPALLAAIGSEGLAPFAAGAGILLIAVVPAMFGAAAAPQVVRPARRSILVFVLAVPAATLAALVFGAVEAGMNLLPIYGLRVGHGEAIAALLASAVAIGNVALQVPIGFASDKVDRVNLLLACGAVALIGAVLMPIVASSGVLFFLLLVVWGGVVAAFYSVGLAHLASHYEGAELAGANAAFVMLYSIGRLVGPAAVGAGMDLWNPHGFAAAMAAFLALYVAVVAIRMASQRAQSAARRAT